MKKNLLTTFLILCTVFTASISISQTITTFPYSEDFESFSTCGTGCGAVCALTGGTNIWTNDLTDNLDWLVNVGTTSSSDTGPTLDHKPGNSSGKYLYIESSCSGTGYPNMTANLISPQIDLTGTNDMQFEFWYHMFGTSMGTMHVDISVDNGSTWVNDIIPSWTDNQDLWQQMTVSLGAYSGQTVTVRIRHITGFSFGSDAAIDDISIYDLLPEDAGISAFINPSMPTCVFNDSIEVVLTNFGTDTLVSADIDWNWNAAPGATVNWIGSLAPGATDTVYLGNVAYMNGDVLSAITSLPNGVIEPVSGSGNDETSITVSTGLNGTYSIGATGDYLTFNLAISDLNVFGVCGPVVFEVEDGVYTEQISLNEVLGMDATNTVTFQSMNMDPDLAILEFAGTTSSDNFVVWMDGGDHFHFDNLTLSNNGTTFGTVVLLNGGAANNSWTNNIILGDSLVSSTSTNMALVYSQEGGSIDSMNVFDNNMFEYGSYAFYYYGNGTTDLEAGTVITNNIITNFYYRGLHMYYQNDLEIGGNIIRSGANYTGSIYRVYIVYGDGGMQVYNNKLNGRNYGYGIYYSNCDALISDRAYTYNNFISVGDTANTSTSYGIYMTDCKNQVVTNNSVNIDSDGASSRCFYNTGGAQNYLLNNILRNNGPGYGLYFTSGIVASDHNNISVPNGVPFYFGADIQDIVTWQGATSFDMNSDTLDPLYTSYSDLHTCEDMAIDAGALPDTLVLTDIDGQVRDALTPDIGADEFLGLSNIAFTKDTIWKCTQDTISLGGWEPTDDAISYLWSSSETTSLIPVAVPGVYDVVVTTNCGSTNPSVEVLNIPDVVAGFTMIESFFTAATTNTSTGTIDSYHWDFGDGFTTSETNPTHLYDVEGTYVVTLEVTGPCGTSIFTDTMDASTIGIDDFSLFNSLSIFPNPTTGIVNIDMGETQTATNVTIMNVLGKVVFNESFKLTSNINFNLKGEAGIYFAKITTEDGKSETIRIVKK
jgi:PKD repeat protein